MTNRQNRRITRELTPAEKERLEEYRKQIDRELPDLHARDRMRKEARDEATLNGELRRSIHRSPLSLAEIATQAGIAPLMLDEYLTGERTLRSDVLDRLAHILGYELQKST